MGVMKAFYLTSALISLIALSSCKKIEAPQFKNVEGFKIKSLGLKETKVGFNVTFYNPNDFGIHVKEAVSDIYIDSVYAGKFVQDEEVDVSKNSNFSIPLTGSIPLAVALKLDLTQLVNKDLLFKANGSVKIGKAGVFITKPFNYQGVHQIKL